MRRQLAFSFCSFLRQLPQLRKCTFCLRRMQAHSEADEWLVEGCPLHGVHHVVFDALACAPIIGAIDNRLDSVRADSGRWWWTILWAECSWSHVGNHNHNDLQFTYVKAHSNQIKNVSPLSFPCSYRRLLWFRPTNPNWMDHRDRKLKQIHRRIANSASEVAHCQADQPCQIFAVCRAASFQCQHLRRTCLLWLNAAPV